MDSNINILADEEIVRSLKIASAISIIAGSWSLLFEIYYFHYFEIDIYIARVLFTVISLFIFIISFERLGNFTATLLIHLLIISLISSFIYTIYKIPDTLFINSQILTLLIFTTAIIFSWEIKNQIIVAIYYNLLFAGSIVFNGSNVSLLPNLFSITIFVCLISLLSVFASAVNYNRRVAYKNKTEEINFIFNCVPIGICRTDHSGNVLTQNDYLIELLEIDKHTKKINLLELIKDSNFKEFFSHTITSNDSTNEMNLILRNNLKKNKYLKLISKNIISENGNNYAHFIFKDDTVEMQAQNEKKASSAKLLNETKEKELLAQMRLMEKNQKIQLLAKINHEVRTPLNSILMFHQMLEENMLHSMDEIKKYSRSVKTAVGHLLNTISNFIDYAKIETGKLEIEFELFNFQDVLEEIVQLLNPLAKGKNINLNLIVENSSGLLVFSDVNKYRQIIINLIANSIKFTRTGSINIFAKNILIENSKFELITVIEDTGIGIPEEKLNDIFNPFVSFSGKNSEWTSSGLGLAICKEFIQMLEGQIVVSSAVGKGTKFVVNIPFNYDFPKSKI